MTRLHAGTRPLLSALLVACLLIPARALMAQGSSLATVTAGAPAACGPEGYTSSGTSSAQIACTGAAAVYAGQASTSAGTIGATSGIQTIAGVERFTFAGQVATYSQAGWYDVMTFSPTSLVPASVELRAMFTGVLSSGHSGPGATYFASARAVWSLRADPIWSSERQASAGARADTYYSDSPAVQYVNQELSLMVPLAADDFGRQGFSFNYYIQTWTEVSLFTNYDSYEAYATADFSSGVALTDIIFYDANGDEMTTGVDYTLREGTELSAAPEPASLLLMGTGLVGIGVMARRRRTT